MSSEKKATYDNPVSRVKNSTQDFDTSIKNISLSSGNMFIAKKFAMNRTEKSMLARHISDNYIEDFSSIIIDAGSTQQLIIEEIMKDHSYLSILTNNMTAFRLNSGLQIERNSHEFILTGGKYVPRYDALLGRETINSFDSFNPNTLIIGVSGFSSQHGLHCHGNDEVPVKSFLFTKNVNSLIIPLDYSKLGRFDSYVFGPINDLKDIYPLTYTIIICPPARSVNISTSDFKKEIKTFESRIKNIESIGLNLDILN